MSEKDNKKQQGQEEITENTVEEVTESAAGETADAAEETYTVTKAQMAQMEELAKTHISLE